MFLPISDAPNPKGTPWVTWALIAVNVTIFVVVNLPLGSQPADAGDPAFEKYLEFLAQFVSSRSELVRAAQQLSAYDLFVFKHGYRPSQPSAADLLVSMFLHGGFLHLFGNMLFLWIYGDNVERRLGPGLFLAAYLATGAAATLFHALVFASSDVPLVGASGAISGVLGFYFVWFPKNVVRVAIFLPPFFLDVIPISARVVLGIYLVFDNLLPFVLGGAGGVAHGAHIGGFVAGAAAAWLISRHQVAARPRGIGAPARHAAGSQTVRDALRDGDWEAAAVAYFSLPQSASRDALSPAEAVELGSKLWAGGQPRSALSVLRRTVRSAPRRRDTGEVLALAGFILLDELNDPAAAYQYLRAALELGPSPQTEAEIRRRLTEIERLQKRAFGWSRGESERSSVHRGGSSRRPR